MNKKIIGLIGAAVLVMAMPLQGFGGRGCGRQPAAC